MPVFADGAPDFATLLERLRRTVVIGTSGSGKTTFARDLAHILHIPHIELDALHWGPAWTERPIEEFRHLVSQAVAGEAWSLDGNYSAVRDIVWPRATAVIWLNYSLPATFYRVLKRTARRVLRQEELYAGNRESFRRSFLSRESILVWVLTTYRRRRREYPRLLAEPQHAHLHVTTVRSPPEAERLLAQIRTAAPGDAAAGAARAPS